MDISGRPGARSDEAPARRGPTSVPPLASLERRHWRRTHGIGAPIRTLGDGRGGTDSDTPRAVAGGLQFVQVSAGDAHACGRTSSGVVHCWGHNASGQLGDGSRTGSDLPVTVDTDLAFGAVSAGNGHTCALARTDAHCWGDNEVGELGDGTQFGRTQPVLVHGNHTFLELGAGRNYTCALTLFNEAFCWGVNKDGQLGDNRRVADSAVPVKVVGGVVFVIPSPLTVGAFHTCAKGIGGGVSTAYCWGGNFSGELGDGSSGTDRDNPVPVVGGLGFVSLDAGGSHTCGVVPSGDAFCWGSNSFGELGDGDTGTDSATPVRVLDPP